jgi:hypothetical protein
VLTFEISGTGSPSDFRNRFQTYPQLLGTDFRYPFSFQEQVPDNPSDIFSLTGMRKLAVIPFVTFINTSLARGRWYYEMYALLSKGCMCHPETDTVPPADFKLQQDVSFFLLRLPQQLPF